MSVVTTTEYFTRIVGLVVVLSFVLTSSCERSSPSAIGSDAATASPRVVSVGSATTETIFALGAGDEVVGVDTSSLFPEAATKLPQVGYQRTLAAEGILSLRPTFVVASAEAGPPTVLDQLRSSGLRVELLSAEPTVDATKARIARIAELLGRDPAKLLAELDADLARASALVATTASRPKVLVLYARGANTLHVFGAKTSADAMVRLAGGTSAVTTFEGSKPLTSEALVQAAPDVLVIPSRGLESVGGMEGLARIPGMAETPAGRAKRVIAMDDLLLLGFGPRLGKAVVELTERLHPELGAVTK